MHLAIQGWPDPPGVAILAAQTLTIPVAIPRRGNHDVSVRIHDLSCRFDLEPGHPGRERRAEIALQTNHDQAQPR